MSVLSYFPDRFSALEPIFERHLGCATRGRPGDSAAGRPNGWRRVVAADSASASVRRGRRVGRRAHGGPASKGLDDTRGSMCSATVWPARS
jgi:hypothetical protein